MICIGAAMYMYVFPIKFTSLFLFSGDRVCFSKAVKRMLGLDLGTVRSPLSKLDVSQELELRKDLERIGFFDWFR